MGSLKSYQGSSVPFTLDPDAESSALWILGTGVVFVAGSVMNHPHQEGLLSVVHLYAVPDDMQGCEKTPENVRKIVAADGPRCSVIFENEESLDDMMGLLTTLRDYVRTGAPGESRTLN